MNEIGDALATLSTGLKTLAEGINVISKQMNQLDMDKIAASAKNSSKKTATKAVLGTQSPKNTTSKKKSLKLINKEKPKTASDTVYDLIKKSNNGVNYAFIIEKTGYNKKKIANIFFNLKKQGKIKSVSKGIYTLS